WKDIAIGRHAGEGLKPPIQHISHHVRDDGRSHCDLMIDGKYNVRVEAHTHKERDTDCENEPTKKLVPPTQERMSRVRNSANKVIHRLLLIHMRSFCAN